MNQRGDPSYGIGPVFAMWLRRRQGTPIARLQEIEQLRFGAEVPGWAIQLAQTETRAFDWSSVDPLVQPGEWAAAPVWRPGDHAAT